MRLFSLGGVVAEDHVDIAVANGDTLLGSDVALLLPARQRRPPVPAQSLHYCLSSGLASIFSLFLQFLANLLGSSFGFLLFCWIFLFFSFFRVLFRVKIKNSSIDFT